MSAELARDALSSYLPIFPLDGVLLLPGGDLPLNIFEPRYVAMIKAALGGDRMIGMIQPCPCPHKMVPGARPFYQIGCAGRIASFDEMGEDRFLVTLHGISRFEIMSHVLTPAGYRMAHVNLDPFEHDREDPLALPPDVTGPCMEKLKLYMEKEGLFVDWGLVSQVPDHRFYTLLAMVCPFSSAEKQALLEAESFAERCQVLKCLLDLACTDDLSLQHAELPC